MTVHEISLAGLSPEEKRALLTRLLEERSTEPRSFPLSFAQRRLWFLHQMDPASPAYNTWSAARIDGRVDVAALAAALREVVRRHDVLRLRFSAEGAEPVQTVVPGWSPHMPEVDLRSLPRERREPEGRRLMGREALRPFDLAAGRLLRVRALRLSPDSVVVFFCLHHIVADGWSIALFLHELTTLYEAFSAGRPSPLPELPIQYPDFAVWQRRRLQGEALEAQLAYWRERLRDAPPVLELGFDRPRPPVQSFRGGLRTATLPASLTARLRDLCRELRLTPFMALVGGLSALLHRCSGRRDLCLGTPVANRTRRELEGLIGMFANTLALRVELPAGGEFREHLARIRTVVLGAYEHQDLPFETLVEELQPRRNLSHSPIFQVMLALQTHLVSERASPAGMALTDFEVGVETAPFDLTLEVTETASQMRCAARYAADLFEATTVERLLAHFAALLESAVDDPRRRLSDLDLLPPAERHQLLHEWNDTAHPAFVAAPTLPELFAAQAARTPDASALIFEDEELSYRELESRAARLARRLRGLGVGPETVVGVCAARSPEQVVALLAVLTAGGAYLPLDPDYPAERLADMLEDTGAPVVLAQRETARRLPETAAPNLLLLDDETPESPAPLRAELRSENLAYVIFTSGSTGRPKGSMISHRAIVNRLLWMQAAYGLRVGERVLYKTPYSFDVSVWELFWPLTTGATMVVARPEGHRDPAYLSRLVAARKVTTMHFVPSMLQAFLDAPELEGCQSLVRVIASGEALPAELARRFASRFTARLENLYGPTEAAVDVSFHPCRPGEASIPIGRPIANLELRVLERRGSPAPVGVPGELHLGGVGLARGYFARPGLTAERFVPHPHAGRPGERLYRTGDLARFRADGNVDFLGRLDHQVKIRGLRVELGEIEAALAENGRVREAVVLARPVAPGDLRLVACVVLREEQADPEATRQALRDALRKKLPEHMVPGVFDFLGALPLTPSGKADRRALLERSLPSAVPRTTAPGTYATPSEELLAAIWSEVLGVDVVHRDDDFFALGGHSLLATQVVSRIRRRLGVEVPVRTLFEETALAGFSRRLEAAARSGQDAVVPVGREAELPLSFAQERLWLLHELEPESHAYNVPVVLRLQGDLDVPRLQDAVRRVVGRHEVLRTAFAEVGGRPVLRVAASCLPAPGVVDLGALGVEARERESRRLAAREAVRPFDLAVAPLLRAFLVRRGEGDHLAFFNLHHIVSDAWSTGVLVDEVAAFFAGREPAALPVQYADFAVWQRRHLAGEELERQARWWREQLDGAPQVLELPTDRPRPPVRGERGGLLPFLVAPALRGDLEVLSRHRGATLFMTLAAAFELLLSRLTAQQDLLVGTPIAGRGQPEVEGLIGFFVNTLVLRGRLAGVASSADFLDQVRETTLAAYAHQDLPFEKLVDLLEPERDLSRTPLFQVMLAFQNTPQEELVLPGLDVSFPELGIRASKFDLTLFLTPTPAGLEGELEYSAELFDAVTVERFRRRYETLLAALAAEPGRAPEELSIFLAAERHQLLAEWNDTRRPTFPSGACLHELLAAQAARTPEACALVFEDERLSYRELEDRAERLGRVLRSYGVGPDARVGLCAERSTELVVALVAILKAGGAYLPLDPDTPAERLAFMVRSAGAAVVLTQARLLPSLPELPCPVLPLEALPEAPAEPLAPACGGDHLAYVIYTSGSTGEPKGSMISHRAITNRLGWMQEAYGLKPDDTVLQKTPFTFDVSVWEFFWPLLVGARLVVARPGGHQDSAYMARRVVEAGVTTMHFVPSMLQAFLAEPALGESRLRRVIVSGEALPPALRDRFLARFAGRVELHNLYGPTEAAVDVTFFPCREAGRPNVPIGRPIANVTTYVCDRRGRPVPLGVAGELLLGGVALARGYLRRPATTARSFVPDSLSGEAGGRLYRTGDLTRLGAGGEIDFLGRIDHQVKLRGLRIELGEIETALGRHDAVRECVVTVERGAGTGYLAAFLVASVPEPPSAAELQEGLRRTLPEHMVPASFTFLAELPRTSSGKVDRRRLVAAAPAVSFTAPRTPAEEVLARIWSDLLGLPQVGTEDNFFTLGGDSILAIQVVSRARHEGWDLDARELFRHPTLGALAAVARRGAREAPEEGVVVGEVPLTPVQRWFFESRPPRPGHFNQALLLSGREPLAPGRLRDALAVLLEHHDALRLRFSQDAGTWRQAIDPPGAEAPFAHVDLAALPAERRRPALEAAAGTVQSSLDLARGPLLRLVLFKLGGAGTRLLWVIHHLAVDGVSWRVLLEDLERLYRSSERGEPYSLPPRTTSFKRWAEALEAHAAGAGAPRGFWLEQTAPPLPADHPGGTNTVASARTVSVTLPAEETRALLREVHSAYRTGVADFLLAALASAFASWTGEPALVVDLEGHGREPFAPGLDPSRTVGWLTTVFPLRLVSDADPGVLLKATKERLRSLPEGGLSWGLLRYLNAETAPRLREVPPAGVLFNYLGQVGAGLSPGSPLGAALESAGPPAAVAGVRRHLFEVVGEVSAGCLELAWTYSENLHRRETVESLAAGFLAALRRLLDHCRQPGIGGLTPSDVPESGLGQAAIDALLSRLAAPPETFYPLSPAQQGMLFVALLERQGSALFNNQMGCILRGPLDAALFREAWQRVVRRHEALSASMVWEDLERPLQVISSRAEVPWIEEDYRALPEEEAAERLAQLVESDRYQGLDLTRAPLMRLTLVRTGERCHHFLWTHHQLILDGWSVQRVLAEVFAAYRALTSGAEPRWDAPVPYRDYVAWIERQDARVAEDFWRRRLAGVEPAAGLGVERRGEGLQLGASAATTLDPETVGRLEAFSRREGLTASTLFQGAWSLLLCRYSGRPEVLSGAVVAGRPPELPGYESIVGLCINVLPVRLFLEGEAVLAAWLAELQDEMAELRRFEHCGVEQIRRWLGASWDRPLFDNLFIFENYPADASLAAAAGDGEVTVERVEVEEAPNYALNLFVIPSDPFELRLVYDAGRFDTATAEQLLDHLLRLLEQMADGTGRRLGELTLFSPGEREQLLFLGSGAADPPPPAAVHLEIARRAALSPGSAAAVDPEGGELSYGELERWANGVAYRLLELDVGPETVVGLSVERSFAMLAGMLGVLKVGALYLPLDPASPSERLAFQIEDAGVRVVLAGRAGHGLPLAGRHEVLLGEVVPRDGDFSGRFLGFEQGAYVIYTSGSTGRPKGVVVSHGSLAGYAAGAAESYGVVAADRALQFASLSFDASVEEIYPTLLRGAALLLRREALGSTSAFLDGCRSRGVTVLNLPTAYWHALTTDAEAAGPWPEEVRLVILGGEEARVEALRGFRRWAGPEVTLVNTYGPTETTVVVTRWWEDPEGSERLARLPIGRPVAGARAYVLDRSLELVGAGVPGEICLGGGGLARGYLRRPALTAAAFVPDPHAGSPGARLYKSGDLGRWHAEQLEFLGRLDHQLKVRGYRVEAGEVEAAILRHPPVREAAVVIWEEAGENRLVAYVSGPGEVAVEPLRAFLASCCPEYMMPHAFVVLDELPRGTSGKVDRRALPPPAAAAKEGPAYVEPRSEVEQVLAEIFADLLGRERVGAYDDFFELGGHSLLATRLATRVRKTFAVEMPLTEVFAARTVADLGLWVEDRLIAKLEAMSDEEVERLQQNL